MSTRIRLRRMGANKRPFYRVVVADQRSPRDGRFIENIGKYHPLEDPSVIEIDEDRALHWLRVGAQPSDQVRNLMVKIGIWDKFVVERPDAAKAQVGRLRAAVVAGFVAGGSLLTYAFNLVDQWFAHIRPLLKP